MNNTIGKLTPGLIIIAACVLFFPLALLVPRQDGFEVLNAIIMGGCAGLVYGYGMSAWAGLSKPLRSITSSRMLIVGMVTCFIGLFGVFAGQWVWRTLDKPDWVSDSAVLLFSRYVLCTGIFMLLTTNWSEEGSLPKASYQKAGLVIMAAVAVAGIMIAFNL
jgi:hypothetical protein